MKSKHRSYIRRQQRAVSCEHYWFYESLIWQARDGRDEVAVGRYCAKCSKMQTAVARNWYAIPKSYVDMRETLEKSISNHRIMAAKISENKSCQ